MRREDRPRDSPPPWYRRFDTLPRLPEWWFPVCMLVGMAMIGFTSGMLWCSYQRAQASTIAVQDSILVLRIQALEQRVRALEQRER